MLEVALPSSHCICLSLYLQVLIKKARIEICLYVVGLIYGETRSLMGLTMFMTLTSQYVLH